MKNKEVIISAGLSGLTSALMLEKTVSDEKSGRFRNDDGGLMELM